MKRKKRGGGKSTTERDVELSSTFKILYVLSCNPLMNRLGMDCCLEWYANTLMNKCKHDAEMYSFFFQFYGLLSDSENEEPIGKRTRNVSAFVRRTKISAFVLYLTFRAACNCVIMSSYNSNE